MLLDVKFHRQAINLKEDLIFRVVCVPDMRLFCKFVIHTCDCLNFVFNCFFIDLDIRLFCGLNTEGAYSNVQTALAYTHMQAAIKYG